ncbi:hypothetical protein LuPra_02165 [Luteitalea pratensis]|uniref:Porin n=1 Tax=Luteitalea pratensis TaxID=1855912 RepID=A0A143PMG3_LUTPR|nr:hypothetical protein [Luteitalea pratensis]AMY08959.1 hypothetical protein LuPra_02165 [Luteitalea pratensis]
MRLVRAFVTAACWLCIGTAAAGQTAPSPEPQTPPPTTDTTPAAPAPQGAAQQPPLNPGQEIAGAEPAGAALALGPAKLRIGGYVGVTGIYRSTSSGGGPGTNFGTIPYEDTLAGSVSETRLTAQSSRLSIRVDAPFTEARFRNISGYFEMDFNGATPGTIAVTSNSAGFRLRQGFADVQYGDHFSMAVGQAFTLMTPAKARLSVWPSDYEMSQAVDTNYLVGMVWERVPQVRFTWRASDSFDWAVSIENPEQQIGEGVVTLPDCCREDIEAQYNTGNEALSVPNLMPDFVTRVGINPGKALHVDIGGVWRVFRHTLAPYDDVERASGGGASVNARVNATASTHLIAQAAYGAGLGRYVGGLVPDVAFRADGSIRAIPVASWVAGIEQVVSRRASVGGYYSGLRTDDTHFLDVEGAPVGFGYPGSSDAVNRSITEITGTVSFLAVRTENRGSAQVGVQTSWLRREPWSVGNGPGSANAFLFFVQMRYNLP